MFGLNWEKKSVLNGYAELAGWNILFKVTLTLLPFNIDIQDGYWEEHKAHHSPCPRFCSPCSEHSNTAILDDFSTVLTQYFGKSFFPFPSSPKTSNWQIPAKYFGCTKPTSSTCNICRSPAPCHVRETDVSLLPFWQVCTVCSKPPSPLFGTRHAVSHQHKVFNQLQTNLPDTSQPEK